MAPIGLGDSQVQALHALSVVDAARKLATEIVQLGGTEKLGLSGAQTSDVRQALTDLQTQVNRLAVFETRAIARGTVRPLADAEFAELVSRIREKPQLSADQQELRDMPQADIDAAFSLDGPTQPAPDPNADPFAI
jgi:hypothetical protein